VGSLSGDAEYNKQVALVADRLDTIVSATGDKLQLLGNINYMRYTHAARSIPRSAWEVRYAYIPLLFTNETNLCTHVHVLFQDFGRLLIESLAASGVSSDDLASWKGALDVLVNGISPKN
jgi:hypothetical protein